MTYLFLAALAATCHAAGDRDTWVAAKAAGAKHGVSATLLVSIRCHENPKRCNDYKACGVKRPGGGWWPGGLRGQMNKCAQIVANHAKAHGWDPRKPTKARIDRLSYRYAEGLASWRTGVWALYRRMRK